MKTSLSHLAIAGLLSLGALATAHAATLIEIQTSYVKADLTNTANAAGGNQTTWFADPLVVGDNRWSWKSVADQGFGTTTLSKDYSWQESVPTIFTTITGLNINTTYEVYVLFDKIYLGSNANIVAGLTQGTMAAYTQANSTQVPGTSVFYAYLGNATGATSIPIYVGDWQTFGEGVNYLGVSAVPEPTTWAMTLLAGSLAAVTIFRRRKS